MKYPVIIQIYLDSVCNLECRFCLYQNRTDIPKTFNINNIQKLENFISHAKTVVLSACGEPLLSPHFPEALDYIYSINKSPNLIAITTNGTLLTPKVYSLLHGHLVDLTISLNAGTPEVYNRDMVKGNWITTIGKIDSFMQFVTPKDKSKIALHMVAHAENFRDIPAMVAIADKLGIFRVRVDQIMVADKSQFSLSLLNVKDDYNQIIKSLKGKVTAPLFGQSSHYKCNSPSTEFHVWADGKVSPCCYNGSLFMGNVCNTSPEGIWDGLKYQLLRKHPAKQCLTCPKILPFDNPDSHIYPYLKEGMN